MTKKMAKERKLGRVHPGFASRRGLRQRARRNSGKDDVFLRSQGGREDLRHVREGRFVVKVPKKQADELVTGKGKRFDPGHGGLMKEWVVVELGKANLIQPAQRSLPLREAR